MTIILTKHAHDRIIDRKIEMEWIRKTIEMPEIENEENGLFHLYQMFPKILLGEY